jgi:hypothetical protein
MSFKTLDSTGSVKIKNPITSITITTTGNIDDLDFNNASLIRMNNASLSTIRGLKAGINGQQVIILSIGAGQVNLAHQNTSSVATNRLINFVTSGITPLAAGKGTSTYEYDATTGRWRLISHCQGSPITFVGAWTGSGTLTFTGLSETTLKYYVDGAQIQLYVNTTGSVGGAGAEIRLTLPNSYTTADQTRFVANILDNNVAVVSLADSVGAASTYARFFANLAGTNWAGSVGASVVQCIGRFAIQ